MCNPNIAAFNRKPRATQYDVAQLQKAAQNGQQTQASDFYQNGAFHFQQQQQPYMRGNSTSDDSACTSTTASMSSSGSPSSGTAYRQGTSPGMTDLDAGAAPAVNLNCNANFTDGSAHDTGMRNAAFCSGLSIPVGHDLAGACVVPPQAGTEKPKLKRRRRKPSKPGLTAKNQERHFVVHDYHDHANDVDDQFHAESFNNGRSNTSLSFPMKLHAILEQAERDGLTHIVSWQPHGRCFIIHKPKEFVSVVMHSHFRQTKLTSFQRQLNLYGFNRLTRGPDEGGYYNEYFLRGKKFLCKHMTRTKVKGTRFKAASNPESEPDFYQMEPVKAAPSSSSLPVDPHVSKPDFQANSLPAGAPIACNLTDQPVLNFLHVMQQNLQQQQQQLSVQQSVQQPITVLPMTSMPQFQMQQQQQQFNQLTMSQPQAQVHVQPVQQQLQMQEQQQQQLLQQQRHGFPAFENGNAFDSFNAVFSTSPSRAGQDGTAQPSDSAARVDDFDEAIENIFDDPQPVEHNGRVLDFVKSHELHALEGENEIDDLQLGSMLTELLTQE